jgi:predicted RNA-binding protein
MPEHTIRKQKKREGTKSEAQVWLCILNRENFEILKERKIYGIPENKRALSLLKNVKIGDTLLFYVISPVRRILGVSSVVSTIFKEKRKAPWRDRLYPYRIRVSEVQDINVRMTDCVGKIDGVKRRVPMGASLILLGTNDLQTIKSLSGNYGQSVGEKQ